MFPRFLPIILLATSVVASAEDWSRFRGPSGNGVSEANFPTEWSPSANIAWKTPLPGPGASSPIIVGDRAFVTCYSGYGLNQENPGELKNLVRHIVCVNLTTGKKLWQKDVKAEMPEDPYTGIGVTAHGYASHTPASDGKAVYAFFGKSGVFAYDLDGNQMWHAKVGMESDPTKWGSSSSPLVHNGIVIVTASAESQSVIGFDAATGKEVWRQEAEGLDGMWGTPAIVEVDAKRSDLVMCVSREMWGMDPASGKLLWFANATGAQHAYSSVVQDGKRVFAVTGRGGGSVAIDAGGSGDVSESNTVWTGSTTASFASPVLHDGYLYTIAQGVMTVIDAESGDSAGRVRLKGVEKTGGRFGSLDYPSPIVMGDHLYYLTGSGQMFVFTVGDSPEQVAINRVTADKEQFRGTPALSEGRMLLRSSAHLYCVSDKGETVPENEVQVVMAEAEPPVERGGRGGGRGTQRRFDPMSMFKGMDKDSDGKVTMAELKGNPMADRLKALDKDSDGSITTEEFRDNIGSLFSRGSGGGGGGGYGQRKDTRPDRPKRPSGIE